MVGPLWAKLTWRLGFWLLRNTKLPIEWGNNLCIIGVSNGAALADEAGA